MSMTTSPAAGSGLGTSSTFNESIGPHARQITARIAFLPVRRRSRRWSITQRAVAIERAGCARKRTLLLLPFRSGPSTVARSNGEVGDTGETRGQVHPWCFGRAAHGERRARRRAALARRGPERIRLLHP